MRISMAHVCCGAIHSSVSLLLSLILRVYNLAFIVCYSARKRATAVLYSVLQYSSTEGTRYAPSRPHARWAGTKGRVRQRAETPSAHKQNENRPSRERSQRPQSLETATSKLDIWSSKSPSHETRRTLSADSAHAASMAAAAPGPGSPSTSSSSALVRVRVRAGVRVRDRVRARESVRAGARDGVRLDEQQQHRRRVPRLAAQSLHRRRPLVRVRVRVRVRVMVGVRVRAGVRVRVGAARPPPSQGPVVACEGDGCVRVIELALGVAVGEA